MSKSEIHVGNVGTTLRVIVKDENGVRDVSTSTIEFVFLKPNQERLEKEGEFYTDGTDGSVKYVFESGDLDIAGLWKYQVKVIDGDNIYYTDVGTFKVSPNI